MVFQVQINFNDKKNKPLIVADSEDKFNKTTILELKKIFKDKILGAPDPENVRVIFGKDPLEDHHTLAHYKIKHLSVLLVVMKMPGGGDPYDDDPNTSRAQISCGHVTGPLTGYCRILLTDCPGCDWIIEISDSSNLSVKCTICSTKNKRSFEFCWQCWREWKGHQPRSDRCDNEGCSNKELDLLRDCPTIILKDASNIECPAVRACPTCGLLINHSTEKCKNIVCPQCKKEFCFVCLKLTPDCLETVPQGWFRPCSDGVAPRQTSISFSRDNQ